MLDRWVFTVPRLMNRRGPIRGVVRTPPTRRTKSSPVGGRVVQRRGGAGLADRRPRVAHPVTGGVAGGGQPDALGKAPCLDRPPGQGVEAVGVAGAQAPLDAGPERLVVQV